MDGALTGARIVWAALFGIVLVYTGWVVARQGWDFVSPFYGAIARGDWQGQFNTDFHVMLILSGWWVAWREGRSARGMLLAILALGLGAPFLCVYLFVLSLQRGATPLWLLAGNRVEQVK
jgi:hypothetical protein